MRSPRCTQGGSTLIESLLAFVLLATGTLAVASLQSGLRLHADIARQRSEAVRLGEQELEALRAFSSMSAGSSPHSYDAIGDADTSAGRATGDDSNTVFRIARRIDAADIAGAKSASVTVGWLDRSGAVQHVTLQSVIAGVDPVYSAALALGAGDGSPRNVLGRSPVVPIDAHALGDGRSVARLTSSGPTAVVFDNVSGAIVARCSGVAAGRPASELSAADVAGCAHGTWASISGDIRFSGSAPPDAAHARDPTPAVVVALALSASAAATPAECSSEPMKTVRFITDDTLHIASVALGATPASLGLASWDDTGDRFVAWRCIVTPGADGRWSGLVTLVPSGWSIGSTAAGHRVCRYVVDASAGARVDDDSIPIARNFLVVRGDQTCPAAVPATASMAAFTGTVQHQP